MADGGARIFAIPEGIREGARQHFMTAGNINDTTALQLRETMQLTNDYGLTDPSGGVFQQQIEHMVRMLDGRAMEAEENGRKANFSADEYEQCSANVCNILGGDRR